MAIFPTESANTYYLTSANGYQISLFNPYGMYYYTATVIAPLLPDGQEDDVVAPTVLFRDFLDWCGTYVDIDDENHALYRLAVLLLEVAKEYIDVDLVGEKVYKQAVCYHAGHYLEMHIQMLKDESQEQSLTPELKEKVIKFEDNLSDRDLFKKTISGRLFWSVYGNKARFSGDETHKMWGGF
jgi:hypothetical protein